MTASKLLGIGASLAALAVSGGGGQQDGLNVLVQHIRTIGPRQWIGLMTASLVPDAPLIAPLAERLDRDDSSSRSRFLVEHDLFRKPDSTFRDHALAASGAVRAIALTASGSRALPV